MAAPGRLTRSGMLYEGNRVEWEDRIFNQIEMTKAGSGEEFRLPACNPKQLERLGLRDPMADSICKQVSPAMLKRVPERDREHRERLLGRLKALARPFRLNDLPPELRARILQAHFGSVTRYVIDGSSVKDKTRQPRWNLLLVSHSIKIEALPLFLGAAEICFHHPAYVASLGDNITVETAICNWVQIHLKENAKYLRHMSVWSSALGELGVHLDMKTGLGLGLTPSLSPQQRKRWVDHVKAIETSRRALGLQGEGVVLALTIKARMKSPS
ncbi:hypothetical protein LTR17_004731 [Elasticomyces elasticus]|nr:hypothetical protein LTR17_004731 [Elasticomyces elasticus]